MLVRNEIDYKSPARFDELLNIYMRILYIQYTSFAFEGIIEESSSGRLIAENIAIHVWLDSRKSLPRTVKDDFSKVIKILEDENVEIFLANAPTY